jgi:hypothetical protein
MCRTPSLRLSRFDPQKAACPGNRRRGKTGIVDGEIDSAHRFALATK